LERIISITRPTNLASRRVMEKLGLTYRGEAFWRGFDQIWYGIERHGVDGRACEHQEMRRYLSP
jgi:RimJ/RimL family protein N-acetyltransferase